MKNKLEKLKGFPLSLEQKERLLELIENNKNVGSDNDSKKSNTLYVNVEDIEGSEGTFTINEKEYRFFVDSDYMYTKSKELYNYCIVNNIEQAIVQMDFETDGTRTITKHVFNNYIFEEDTRVSFALGWDMRHRIYIENDEWE